MKPVFMLNDLGGIVYVGKNTICVKFAVGVNFEFRVNTKELLSRLEKKVPNDEIETDKFLIELFHKTPEGVLNVIITVKYSEQDEDVAVVAHWDLVEALMAIEIPSEKIAFD